MAAPSTPLTTTQPADPGTAPRRAAIAIVGGGITGLAAAQRLAEFADTVQVTLYEASGAVGGVLRTEERDGYLVEHAADMFATSPAWAVALCQQVGLDEELLATNDQFRKTFVVRCGKLTPVPAGFLLMQPTNFWSVLKTPVLSWRGKLRLGMEYFVPRRHRARENSDESLASFVRRRLGGEAFDRLVQPLVGGIYTADPEKLSLAATLPRFLDMEREYRSLIRAAWEARKQQPRLMASSPSERAAGVRYGMFVTPRRGMASMVQALTNKPGGVELRLRTPIQTIERNSDGRWRVACGLDHRAAEEYDAIILATPAGIAAKLLGSNCPTLTNELQAIEYASTAIVCLGYQRRQISHALDGFGFVVPAVERRRILAASFASVKFAGRAPANSVLLRVFIGGALQPELLSRDDDELARVARDELAALIGARGDPELTMVVRWNGSMPQYHLGHLERVARIEARVADLPGLQLAGNAYGGVGIPHCIHSGQQAADRALVSLRSAVARKG